MNKIALNRPILLNKRYVVYLDSVNKFSFKSKREAQDFIVSIQKKMEEAILFITEELNSLEEFYRLYYLADRDFKFKYEINTGVDFINNRLSWIQSRTGGPNFNSILYQAITGCISQLEESFLIMQNKAATRKDTITKRRCSLKVNLLKMYSSQLAELGIKEQEIKLTLKKTASCNTR